MEKLDVAVSGPQRAIDKAPAQYLNFNELEYQEIESPLN